MRRHLASLAVVLAFAAAMFAAIAASTAAAPAVADDATTPVAAEAGYSLYDLPAVWRDPRGDSLRLADLAGQVRVVAMVYTSCHASCPLIVRDMKAIEAELPAERRDDVGFVLVSLDPERDTPGRMAHWAETTQLDQRRWTLLAGDDGAVRELAATLGVRYQRQPDGEVAHTNVITVLDRDGVVVHRQVGFGTDATIAAVTRLLH